MLDVDFSKRGEPLARGGHSADAPLLRELMLQGPFMHRCAASLQSQIIRREFEKVVPALFSMRTLPGGAILAAVGACLCDSDITLDVFVVDFQ